MNPASVRFFRSSDVLPVLGMVLLLVVSGCDDTLTGCTRELRPGLLVEVTNAETGEPEGAGSLVVATEGAFADSVDFPDDPDQVGEAAALLAHERAGTYSVRVEKTGFATWSRDGVEVTEGPCHVNTVRLKAELQLES